MTFRQGLLHARSHLVFIAGLLSAVGLILYFESLQIQQVKPQVLQIEKTSDLLLSKPSALNYEQLKWAKIAWKYFENNTQNSGLVNSVDKYPATTLWDQSSYLLAMIAAYRLALINKQGFDDRLTRLLDALSKIPLFDDAIPNKSYNTVTLTMVDYNNKETKRGIGWSAIDIARFLVPLNIILWNYPEHGQKIKSIVARWKLSKMIREGIMYGATLNTKGETEYVQEGRIGYEEYAARSLALLGFDVNQAARYDDHLLFINIDGVDIPTDSRDPSVYKAHNYVVSESYLLHAMEFGLAHWTKEFALRVYRAQERRYRRTGILTAVSEDNIDRPPYFVYNTVFSDGKAWNTITDTGEDASAHKTLSTKAALGWHFLLQTDYTKRLVEEIKGLYDKDRGWYSGRYEADKTINTAITANTNAVILESLHYRQFGPLVAMYPQEHVANQMVGRLP